MKTLVLFSGSALTVPASTAWYLDTLGEFRGKQELCTRQSPQKLKVLRERALIESAVSSNRIEGVSVEASRIQTVLIATKPLFRDRDEEEIRGYRDALAWIHDHSSGIPLDENTIKRMHSMARGQIWDAGQYKDGHGRAPFRGTDSLASCGHDNAESFTRYGEEALRICTALFARRAGPGPRDCR